MERYLCIHGHFYQPPRENPWLEAIEIQDSAHPYHDWNERVTAECYAPNSASRILDGGGHKMDIVRDEFEHIGQRLLLISGLCYPKEGDKNDREFFSKDTCFNIQITVQSSIQVLRC